MKKYILGAIVIVMVAVASAFAMTNKTATAKSDTTYWFLMDASGTQVTTTQVTDPSTLCPFTNSSDCARKYNQSQTEVVNGIRQVLPSQVNAQIDSRSKE